MRVIVAETAGFCFGVKRAVSICENSARELGNCFTLGPIIHNAHVTDYLETLGVVSINDASEATANATVIIRSHGAGKNVYEKLESLNVNIIDATCPDVKRIHHIVSQESSAGRLPIIIGDRDHPEVYAIAGWCSECVVLQTQGELDHWLQQDNNANKAISFVFQTTSNKSTYHSFVEKIKKECTNSKVFDTICNATTRRQHEAEELSKSADVVLVIGDKNSANSLRLAEICKENCHRVFFIVNANELEGLDIRADDTVAITAGASTPAWIIKEVTQKMISEDVKQDETNVDTQENVQQDSSTLEENPDSPESVDAYNSPDDSTEENQNTIEDAIEPIDKQAETELQYPCAEAEAQTETEPTEINQDSPAQELQVEEEEPLEQASRTNEETGEQNSLGIDTGDAFSYEEASLNEESFEEMLEKSIITLHTGQRITGIVTSITSTEVSVDLGTKQSGYIPISEFTDDQNSNIEDIVKIGDSIESFVMRVNDVEGMVMLSKKRLDAMRNWTEIETAKDERIVVEGIVSEENKGGVVVNIKGIRVFIPASQTGLPKSAAMTDLVKKSVRLVITEVNQSRRRVVGSIRAVQAEERREKSQRLWGEIEVGKQYDGVVKSMTSYGVFVDIGGVDGMIHISELSWTRIKQPSEVMSVGDEVSVYVLSFDKDNKKISLGYKKAEDNPWTKFTTQYSVGDIANVKIVKMMPFGAFAEICPGVDGLIHISQITDHRIGLPSEVLSDEQLVDVKITEIDYERKKVSLSIRALIAPGTLPLTDGEVARASYNTDRTPVVVFDTDSPPDNIEDYDMSDDTGFDTGAPDSCADPGTLANEQESAESSFDEPQAEDSCSDGTQAENASSDESAVFEAEEPSYEASDESSENNEPSGD